MAMFNEAEWEVAAGKHGVTLRTSVGEAYSLAKEAEEAGCWRIAARIYSGMLFETRGGPKLSEKIDAATFACPICGTKGMRHAADFHCHIIKSHGTP